jgi:hypothetical protein
MLYLNMLYIISKATEILSGPYIMALLYDRAYLMLHGCSYWNRINESMKYLARCVTTIYIFRLYRNHIRINDILEFLQGDDNQLLI